MIKLKLIGFAIAVGFFLAPIHVLMLLVGTFIILDTLAGRWCAKKQAQKLGKDVRLEVTSKKTRTGLVSKLISYQISIILLFVIDDYILNDLVKFFWVEFPIDYVVTKAMGLILIAIEIDSIDESYYKVHGVKLKDIAKKKIKSIKNLVLGIKNTKKELDS